MNVHFDLEPPLFSDAYLQARSGRRRSRTFGKSIYVVHRIAGSMRRVWMMFGIWLVHRHVMRELQMLDDRMLADIGIGRSEISALAHRAVRCTTNRHKNC